MKKTCTFAIIVMMSIAMLLPINTTSALEKLDKQLIKIGLSKTDKIPVIIEFFGNTVVDDLTFSTDQVFPAFEMMRTDNILTKTSVRKIDLSQDIALGKIQSFSKNISLGTKYQYVFNGCYAEIPANMLEKVASLESIKSIQYCVPQYPDRTRSRVFLGCEKTWNSVKDAFGNAVNGNGIIAGVTDSGFDYTHQDFGSQSTPKGAKVLVSKDLAYKDNDCQEEEEVGGHGTSCGGIVFADGPFNPLTKVWEKGLAPKAKVVALKIGLNRTSPYPLSSEGIMASWDENVKNKVQVSNNSYGAPGGSSYTESAQNKAVLAGVCVVASQGNNGSPGPGLEITSGSTATPANVIAVASLNDNDAPRIEIVSAPNDKLKNSTMMSFFGRNGKTLPTSGPYEVIDCGWGRTADFEGIDVRGKIALIQRGPSASLTSQFGPSLLFRDKCINAANAGAKAMILYNYNGDLIRASYYDPSKENPADFKFIPSMELFDYKQGLDIREALHNGHEWTLGTPDKQQNKLTIRINVSLVGNLAPYTSAGPTYRGFLKPDVGAPGEDIHTTMSTTEAKGKKDQYTDMFGGTSAAGPMVAGCAVLVRQAVPSWSPFEVKRALMNTAEPLKRYAGDYYLPMIYQGQGRVNALNAINTPILFNPPSALILAETGQMNIADIPSELFSDDERSKLPLEVQQSRMPVKVTNYSNKNINIKLSFEVNSAYPDQFNVNITNSELTIPPVSKTGAPGVAWFGVTVDLPPDKVKGFLNDIYIWATDRATNRKWHVGICVYNNNPTIQGATNTYAGYVNYEKAEISPNGDGTDDVLKVKYEVTNGSIFVQYYENFLLNLQFWVVDQNYERWVMIKQEGFLEIGPHSFEWDGKDVNGNYVLPDGDWSMVITCDARIVSNRQLVTLTDYYEVKNTTFAITNSPVQSLPVLSAFITPMEPGVGQQFQVGVHIKNAKNVKSIQFKMKMPGFSDIAQYMGYEKGDFIIKDEPMTLFTSEYDKEKDQFTVDIQRPLDGVTGDGWVLNLKFLAKDANYFDIQFFDLNISMINDSMKEVKTKAFYKNSEISIYKDSFEQADINRDGKIDDADLRLMMESLGSVDGDNRYNWRCDLNFDKAVNMDDMSLFSKQYKKR
jgi:minor extracellular serine protease Vpr